MANVSLSESDRTQVGRLICDYVDAGLNQMGSAPDWWADCERARINAIGTRLGDTNTPDDPGYEVFHVPLSQPRQDALCAQVCTVLAKQDPILLNTSDDDEIAEAKQQILQRILKDARFSKRLRRCATTASDTDLCYMRACPVGSDGRVELSVHHPTDVVVFPALPSGLEDATIVGHRIGKPRRHILQMQDQGRYYDDGKMLSGGGDHNDQHPNVERERSGANDEYGSGPRVDLDETVNLWDVVVRIDLGQLSKTGKDWTGRTEKLYRATVAIDDRKLLALEEYPYEDPWYFEFRFIGSREYRPATSVGRNLLPSQQAYNNLWSGFYHAAMVAAEPPIFGPEPQNGEKMSNYGIAQFVASDAPAGSYFSPSSQAQVGAFPDLIANLERVADKVARISQNTTGGDVQSQTATEASIVASGVAVGLEEYIEEFSSDLPRMARLIMRFVAHDPEPFAARFGMVDSEGGQNGGGLLGPVPQFDPIMAYPTQPVGAPQPAQAAF